jgi:hypothetical protein
MEGTNGYSLADIGMMMGNRGDGFFGGNGGGLWIAILFLFVLMGGNGFGGFGANAQYATSNEVQRGFDNQNTMANQREILSAVTAGTSQSVAATNQAFHDNLNVIQDKYGELTRDIYGVSGQVAQVLANQNACCCDTKMLISETAAQNRYDALKNTNDINAVTIGQTQKILDALAQNKISALEGKVAELQLANQMQNVVRYPSQWAYNAGPSPFCGGCGCSGI